MYFVYIIQSSKNSRYYIGCTNDIERRLAEHTANKTKSLKKNGPFLLMYKESFETLIEARKRELKIKSYKGGEAFRRLFASR